MCVYPSEHVYSIQSRLLGYIQKLSKAKLVRVCQIISMHMSMSRQYAGRYLLFLLVHSDNGYRQVGYFHILQR